MATTKKQEFQPERLLKLARHLKYGKLGHEKFDFCVFNEDVETHNQNINFCGTNGCAIGECPIVFPKNWRFIKTTRHNSNVGLLAKRLATFDAAEWFFGISMIEALWLFSPYGHYTQSETAPWNKKPLQSNSTKTQVADSIFRFVAWKTKQLISEANIDI